MNYFPHETDKFSSTNKRQTSTDSHHNIVEVDEMLRDLVPDFMSRRHQELQELDKWNTNHDFTALSQYGHKLKGSSLNYGFKYLGGLAAGLESAARSEHPEEIQSLITEIKEHIHNVQIVYVNRY